MLIKLVRDARVGPVMLWVHLQQRFAADGSLQLCSRSSNMLHGVSFAAFATRSKRNMHLARRRFIPQGLAEP
jgi:hypothetical protein